MISAIKKKMLTCLNLTTSTKSWINNTFPKEIVIKRATFISDSGMYNLKLPFSNKVQPIRSRLIPVQVILKQDIEFWFLISMGNLFHSLITVGRNDIL